MWLQPNSRSQTGQTEILEWKKKKKIGEFSARNWHCMMPLKISFKNYSNRFPDILPTFFLIPKQIKPFIIEPEASLLGLFILKNTGKMSQKIYSNLFSNFVSSIRQSYVIVTKWSHLFHERNKGHYKTQSSRGFLTGCVESLNLPSFYFLCIFIYLSQNTPNFLECNLSD